jgi:hypothetical protein
MSIERTFRFTKAQMEKFDAWRESKKDSLPPSTVGGAYTFCFTPSSIGEAQFVKCVDGTELDLTDYENW